MGIINKYLLDIETKGGKKSEQSIKGVTSSLGSMPKKMGVVAGAYFGSKALLDGIRSSITAYGVQEQAEKKLATALGKTSTSLLSQASALQKVTKFGDEATIQQMSYLASIGLTEQQIQEMIPVAMDLASATGMTLEGAVRNTAKTLSGMTGELGESVPALRELTAEQLKAGDGVKVLGEMFSGMASADADTLTGSIEQMQNAIGDTQEAIGKGLAPVVQNLAGWFMSASEFASNFFLSLTETNLETTIRKLQEMGQETLQLELIQAKASLVNMEKINGGVRERSVVQDELNESINAEFDALNGIATQQAKLVEQGYTEEQLRNLLKIVPRHRDYTNEQIKQIKNDQEKGRVLLSDLDNHQARLEIHERETAQLNEELDKSIDLESSRQRVLNIEERMQQAKSGGGGEDDSSTAIVEQMALEDLMYQTKIDAMEKQGASFVAMGVSEVESQKWVTQQKKMLWAEEHTAKMNTISAMVGGLSSLAKQHKQGALVSKRLAQGQAIIDTYSAGTKALAGGVPPWNYIAMAGVIATGLSNVAQIEAQPLAEGMSGIVTKPTLFMAGEDGAESVNVTNLEKPDGGANAGGGGITLNISAPLVDESVIDHIIPALERANRMSLA